MEKETCPKDRRTENFDLIFVILNAMVLPNLFIEFFYICLKCIVVHFTSFS